MGYPQDRAFAMTADRECELRENIDAGRFLLHTCRGMKGYSGAPILVNAGGGKMQVAGIQIASLESNGTQKMIAVPAQAILRQDARLHRRACGGRGRGAGSAGRRRLLSGGEAHRRPVGGNHPGPAGA